MICGRGENEKLDGVGVDEAVFQNSGLTIDYVAACVMLSGTKLLSHQYILIRYRRADLWSDGE